MRIETWENTEFQVTTVHNKQFESSNYYLQIVNLHVVGSVFTKTYSRKIECSYLLKLSFDSLYCCFFMSMVLSKTYTFHSVAPTL